MTFDLSNFVIDRVVRGIAVSQGDNTKLGIKAGDVLFSINQITNKKMPTVRRHFFTSLGVLEPHYTSLNLRYVRVVCGQSYAFHQTLALHRSRDSYSCRNSALHL